MSLQYTPPPGSGDSLWMSPPEIQLNTATPVTGINAPLPGDTRFRKVMRMLLSWFAMPGSGDIYESGNDVAFSGVADSGGASFVAGVVYNNKVTGEEQKMLARVGAVKLSSDDGTSLDTEIELTPALVHLKTENLGSGDNFICDDTATERTETVNNPGGGISNVRELDITGFQLRTSTAPGTEYFIVRRNGTIRTNQAKAAGVVAPNGNCIEFFNIAGVSQGVVLLNS